MNEKDRQFVLDNVDNINADVHDIDELCCALEHSTIFAVDYIQTFATRLIDLDYKYKNLQSKIDKAIEYIEKDILNKKIEEVDWDFDDCYFSDMPAERVKPLIDILKGDDK